MKNDEYIFVDGATDLLLSGGVVRFALTATVSADTIRQREDIPVARLAMPIETFVALHRWMGVAVEKMTQEGILAAPVAPAEQVDKAA